MIRAHSSSAKPPTPVPKAGSASDSAPSSSATRRQLSVVRRTSAAFVRRSWPMTAPCTTQRAGRFPAGVATASPTSIGPCRTASRSISSPPARLIAPATPPPIQSRSFAALPIASTSSAVMSPSRTSSSVKERLEADRQPGWKSGQAFEREEDTGNVRIAGEGVVTDRQELTVSSEQDLLVRDEAGKAHGMDLCAAQALGRRLGRAGRSVLLLLAVQLDDLGAWQVARRLLGQPHHQHRADREVRCVEHGETPLLCRVLDRFRVPTGRADHARDAGGEGDSHVLDDSLGRGEIDHRLGVVELHELVPGSLERRRERRSNLPPSPVQGNLHAAAAVKAGLTRSTAAWKRSSLGPMPAAESRSGASSRPASSASASGSTASISAMIRSIERISVSVISDLPRRLIRFEVDSIESRIRPLRFSFARSSSLALRLPAATSAICSAAIARHSSRFSSRVPT